MAEDAIDSGAPRDAASQWPLRPWLLAGLLGLAGLLIHLATHEKADVPWRTAVAAFVLFGSLGAAFTVDRARWKEPAIFALAIGVIMAGLAWRAVNYGDQLADEQYGFASGVVATALALPLFQAGFVKRRFATPYADIYHHIWTDAISAAGALAFTGLAWVALAILAKLFQLLRIDFLHDLMNDAWFGWTYSGLAFGAALGVLRNELKVLDMLRTVVLLVLSLLAVPLALGLAVFLLASAISGPQVLWEATRSATPTLLACAAGAFVLTSVILRQDDPAMTGSGIMRIAALALAIVILPLAVFAAVSLGLRLNQYGLAPERLWGLVTVIVACAWGVGYWGALIRGRKAHWARRLREANFYLAVGTCVLALLLALPILDFASISTRDQLARLKSGKVSAKQFDYDALKWDFGDAGKVALKQLERDPDAQVAKLAREADERTFRSYPWIREGDDNRVKNIHYQFDDPDLRSAVEAFVRNQPFPCAVPCVALDLGLSGDGKRHLALVQGKSILHLIQNGDSSVDYLPDRSVPFGLSERDAKDGQVPKVEVRPLEARQIYVDGKAVGDPFD